MPFFVFGRNAFAEGLGEELHAVDLPLRYFLVVNPRVHVATDKIFRDPLLTRDSKIVTMAFFLEHTSKNVLGTDEIFRNDMQAAVIREYAEVAAVIDWFSTFTTARMTGSGASVFAAFDTKAEAEAAYQRLPERWLGQVTASLAEHPLFAFA